MQIDQTTDCISRQAAIESIEKAYCNPCKERGDDYNEVRCRSCNFDDAILQIDALPPVKLKNPCDSLLKSDSDECKEQKSKLDCISRQQAVEAVTNTIREKFSLADWYEQLVETGLEIENLIKELPPVTPTVKVQQEETLIIAAALWYFAQDSERNISDRERAEELREQVLAYGASMCHVTPTERTGEWEHDGSDWENRWACSECGYKLFEEQTTYCGNCGSRNKGGDTE